MNCGNKMHPQNKLLLRHFGPQMKDTNSLRESKSKRTVSVVVFFVFLLLIIVFHLSPSIALLLGLSIGIFVGNPFPSQSKKITKHLLQMSVVGLGFGMNFTSVVAAGKDGFVFTLLTISSAIGLGFVLGKLLRVEKIISYLISVGTAICGGSAIAAVSQVVEADEKESSQSPFGSCARGGAGRRQSQAQRRSFGGGGVVS